MISFRRKKYNYRSLFYCISNWSRRRRRKDIDIVLARQTRLINFCLNSLNSRIYSTKRAGYVSRTVTRTKLQDMKFAYYEEDQVIVYINGWRAIEFYHWKGKYLFLIIILSKIRVWLWCCDCHLEFWPVINYILIEEGGEKRGDRGKRRIEAREKVEKLADDETIGRRRRKLHRIPR